MTRLAIAAVALSGCGLRLGSKDVTVTDTARVQSAVSFAAFGASGVNAAFTQQGVDTTHIESARLLSFALEATSPPGRDLSFFKSGSLFVQTSDADRSLIATADAFPMGAVKVDFTVVPDVELRPFLAAPTYQIVPDLPFARPPPLTGVDVQATAIIRVEVRL